MDGVELFGLRQASPGVCGLYGRVNCEPQEGLHQGGPSRTAAARASVFVVNPGQSHLHQRTSNTSR